MDITTQLLVCLRLAQVEEEAAEDWLCLEAEAGKVDFRRVEAEAEVALKLGQKQEMAEMEPTDLLL